jgi:hypothetical protein
MRVAITVREVVVHLIGTKIDDFVTAPHTCCNQQERCKHGFHDAEDGILSPDWGHRSYDTAHM